MARPAGPKQAGLRPAMWLLLAIAAVFSLALAYILTTVRRSEQSRLERSAGKQQNTQHGYSSATGVSSLQGLQQPVPSCSCPSCPSCTRSCPSCQCATCPPSSATDVRSLALAAKRVYGYESPIVDIDTMAMHAPAFKRLPSEVFSPADLSMVQYWRTLQPYTREFKYAGHNAMFGPCDGAVLHAFIRHTKPRRVYEVGSGHSTHVAHKALEANAAEGHPKAKHLCVEPYRAKVLKGLDVQVVEKLIQDVDLVLFDQLEAGDLLFLDNSHVIRPYGDVLYELLWIMPRLKPGVFVHLHDILLPFDYLPRWMGELRAYTEQYLLAAFLYGNMKWKVVFHNGHWDNTTGALLEAMGTQDRASYLQLCSFNHVTQIEDAVPASIYLQRVE